MAEFQRYQRSVAVTPAGVSNAKAQSFKSLSSKLQSFANQQGQLADQSAAREGELAGQLAASGKSSGVQMQDADTIRGQAFNKGAMMAHAAQIQIDVRSDIANFSRTNQLNVEGFDSQVKGMKDGLLKEVDPILRPHAEQEINNYAASARTKIQDNVFQFQTSENLATITTAVEGMEEDALQAAREGNEALYESKIAQISAIYTEGINDGLLDANKIAQASADFSEKIDSQLVLGYFDKIVNTGDLTSARAELDKFKKSNNKDLSPATKDTVVQKVQTKINALQAEQNRQKAIAKAEQTAKEKALATAVKDAEKSLDNGFFPENLETLIDQAKGTKYETQIKEAQIHANAASKFVMLSPAQQEAEINRSMESKSKSGSSVRWLDRMEKIHDHTVSELAKDGLSLAVEQGVVPQVDPVDLNNPESMATRVLRVGVAEAHYKQDISPLTAAETDQIAAQFSNSDADQKIGMLNAITSGFGNSSIEVLKQLDKKNHTLFAHAGALVVDGAPEVARLAIIGNEQAKLNKSVMPKDSDMMTTVNDYLGSVFVANPKHQASVVQTAKAVYAGLAIEAGDVSGIVDTDLLESALEQVTGGILEIEADGSGWIWDDTYKIQAPARGVTEAQFQKYLGKLRPGDVDEMGGALAYSSDEAVEQIQEGILVNAGKGKYLVNIGSGYLLNKDGDPFEFVYGVKAKGKSK